MTIPDFSYISHGPLTAEEDENGIIHLKNQDGYDVLMMIKQDYQDLLKYKKDMSQKTLNKWANLYDEWQGKDKK